MSEHEPISAEELSLLREESKELDIDGAQAVYDHVMYDDSHYIEGQDFSVFYGGGDADPELKVKFDAQIRAHEAAILRDILKLFKI